MNKNNNDGSTSSPTSPINYESINAFALLRLQRNRPREGVEVSIGSYNLKLKEKSRANEEEIIRADLIAYTTHEEA